jgi:hypothetical protein
LRFFYLASNQIVKDLRTHHQKSAAELRILKATSDLAKACWAPASKLFTDRAKR